MRYSFDEFELDSDELELRRAGMLLKVDALVLRLLLSLVRSAGRVVTKEALIDEVWDGRAIADNAITVSMARLRKTLGESRGNRELIATVYGRGYRFMAHVAVAAARKAPASSPQPVAVYEPPFVGRQRVLQRLLESLEQARSGRGRACLLLGEPGIGKTRVVEELERAAQARGIRVAWGYCREAGDTPPLWPWLRLLREVTAGAWNEQLVLEANEGTAIDASLRHALFDSIVRALTTAAEHEPWVLVLEDLHRADAGSIELLSQLLDEISRARILVVATVRHARTRGPLRPETHLPRVLGHRNSERITLERLEADEVSSYVAAMLHDPDGKLGRAVFDKSEGNPFFMTELSRSLSSDAAPSAKSLEVPDTALDLLRQRVAKLDPDARAVLQAAAVIGRSFELPLLATILDREPAGLMTAIDQAIADEIVIAAPDSLTAFAFGHELQRAVLYDALSPRDRRSFHLRIADALDRRLEQGESIPPSELAYHSHAALPAGDLRATVRRCRSAANAAAAVFAIPDVLRHARRALEALDLIEDGSVRLRMSLLYQIAAYTRGHSWAEEERATRELTRLANEHSDGVMLAHAATMLNIHPELKPLPGAAAAAERALELLPADNLPLRALAMSQLACSAPRSYSRDQSIDLMREAAALARESGERRVLDPVLVWQMYLQGGPDYEHAASLCAELDQLALKGTRHMAHMPLSVAIFRATVALQRGDGSALRAALLRAESLALYLNHLELLWFVKHCQAMCRINEGALAEGRAQLVQLHSEAEQRGTGTALPLCAFDRAVIFDRASRSLADEASLTRALEHDASDPPGLWALKIRALSTIGQLDEARASLRMLSPQALAQLPCDSQYLGTLGHLTRSALLLDATEYYAPLCALLARYPSYFSAQISFLCEGAMPTLHGRLLLALERRAEALEQMTRGHAAELAAGFSFRAAETQLVIEQLTER